MASAKSSSAKYSSPKINENFSNDFGKVNFHVTRFFNDKMINEILGKYDKEALINSEQLANILNKNEFRQSFYSINFDLELCKLFISTINNPNNAERTDSIKVSNVFDIYRWLHRYKDIFSHYDTSNSGLIEPHQLSICISKLGFYLSPSTIKSVVDHYSVPFYSALSITPMSKINVDTHNNNNNSIQNFEPNIENSYDTSDLKFETDKRFKITFQQFVKCCTKLKALSDMFHERDLDQNRQATGKCSFNYEEFIRLLMNL